MFIFNITPISRFIMTLCDICDQLEQDYDTKVRCARLYKHYENLETYYEDSYSLLGGITFFFLGVTTMCSSVLFTTEPQPQTNPSTALLISTGALSFFALTSTYSLTTYYKVRKHMTLIKNELLTLGMQENDFIRF